MFNQLVDDEVVFAAILPEIAVAMSGHWTDDDFYFGHSVSTKTDTAFVPYTFTERKTGAFEYFFKGKTYLYTVSSEEFEEHPKLQDFEVVSYESVAINSVINVDDALAYMEASPYIRLVYK